MGPIKVLIVEDKAIVAESISVMLKKHGLEVVGVCDSGEEAIRMAEALLPDLILMDVELAGALDGISAASMIQKNLNVLIIYLSDYTDQKTVDRAKKTLPANYIAKPFVESDVIRAIELAFHNAQAFTKQRPPSLLRNHVFLRDEKQVFVKLAYQEIIYLRAGRAYCDIVTDNKVFTLSTSMNHVHDQIQNKDFVRVHRSYIVNVNKITALDGNIIKLGEKELQMSKEFREDLVGRLKFIR
jgi:DNA-binding LytR/AlgR family response regulator